MDTRTDGLTHGKASTYQNHRCRCDECKAAQTAAMKAWRKANPRKQQAAASRDNERLRAAGRWVRKNHPEVWERIKEIYT